MLIVGQKKIIQSKSAHIGTCEALAKEGNLEGSEKPVTMKIARWNWRIPQ